MHSSKMHVDPPCSRPTANRSVTPDRSGVPHKAFQLAGLSLQIQKRRQRTRLDCAARDSLQVPPRITRFKLDFDECRYALQEPVPSARPRNLHSAPVQIAKSSDSQLTNNFIVITPFVRPITPLPEGLPRRRLGLSALMPRPAPPPAPPLHGSVAEHEQG